MDDFIPTIVIAKHGEDLSWVKDKNHVVIEKEVDLPNKGREPSSYIKFIVDNYDSLEGSYVFTQGNPYDHCKDFDELIFRYPYDNFLWFDTELGSLRCDMMGKPHDNVNIRQFLKDIGLEHKDDFLFFKPNCIFRVTAERIRRKPKSFYDNLFKVLMNDVKAPYAFERCVEVIFGD